jgi:ribosomal protein L11 methyltransferase
VQWLEIKIVLKMDDVNSDQLALAMDLLADVFYSHGLKGVVIDDPVPDPLADWGSDAVPPAEQPGVAGYLPMDDRLEKLRLDIENEVAALAGRLGFQYDICCRDIDEEDWAESWKAFFHPQKVSDTLVIKPTWRPYTPSRGEQVIEIDPGMAFGTGTHPTTILCLRLLEKYIRPGHHVLDVGTGSGILLIAAARLGAAALTGVDSDPLAVETANKNLVQNRIDPQKFSILQGDLVNCISRPHHVVAANILAHVIIDLLDDVPKVMSPGGLFICSGIIKAYENDVAGKMTRCGLEPVEVLIMEDWVAMVGRAGLP